jgi:hypothetical protein
LPIEEATISRRVRAADIGAGAASAAGEISCVAEGDAAFMVVFPLEDGLRWLAFVKMK